MAYRVAWSPRAIEDLDAIAQYIAADSTAYAAAFNQNNSQHYPEALTFSFFRSGSAGVVSGSLTVIESFIESKKES